MEFEYNIIVHCNGNPTVAEMLKSTQALTVTSLANAEGGNERDWKWRTQACSASIQEEVEVEAIYLTLKDCCI